MLLASAGALLATSDVEHPVYRFEKSSDGPRAVLSVSQPNARFLLRVRVDALGPEQVDTRESALATVHGTIASSTDTNAGAGGGPSASAGAGTDAGSGGTSPFVSVRFGESEQASDAIAALTSFNLARPLHFSGDCAKPDQGAACQAELELDFDLTSPSALKADESLSIEWSVDFEARAFKPNGGSDVTSEAPWTIEIVELSEP